MEKIIEIFKDIHSNSGKISAKRFYGGVGFIACIIMICVLKHDLIAELMYTSASMIGLDTIRQIIKK